MFFTWYNDWANFSFFPVSSHCIACEMNSNALLLKSLISLYLSMSLSRITCDEFAIWDLWSNKLFVGKKSVGAGLLIVLTWMNSLKVNHRRLVKLQGNSLSFLTTGTNSSNHIKGLFLEKYHFFWCSILPCMNKWNFHEVPNNKSITIQHWKRKIARLILFFFYLQLMTNTIE